MIIKIFLFNLFYLLIRSETNTCVMTSSTGCIYSNSYDLETQFVCGAMQAGNVPPIYDKATQGCCNQGVPYSKELEFCCNNEIYPAGSGQCVQWFRADVEKYPKCYDCTDNPSRSLSYKDIMMGQITSSIDEQEQEQIQEIQYEEKFIPNPNYLRVNKEDKSTRSIDQLKEQIKNEININIEQMESLESSTTNTKSIETNQLELESVSKLDVDNNKFNNINEFNENNQALAPTPVHIDRKLATWPTSDPFDTIAAGPSPTPCTLLDDKVGCFNSYQYYYVTHYPCYNYLLTWSVFGCCDGIPYRHQSQTCCYIDDKYVVKNSNTWCTCQSYECEPSAAPTKTFKSKKPTIAPTIRPTRIPTVSFAPTSSAPTELPTVTFKPTPAQVTTLSANDNKEVFHPEYIYGGTALLFVGLTALMYFQSRASRLITQRHHIVLEIDEAT